MTTVLIVSPLRLLRESLHLVLTDAAGQSVTTTAGAAKEALSVARQEPPQVAVVDLDTPGADALETAALLAGELPGTSVVTLTAHRSPGLLRRALAAGVRGFATRDQQPEELAELIERVARGERVIEPRTAAAALPAVENPLTRRECEVLALTVIGLPTRAIARRLHLSSGTVRNYLSDAVRKLGCSNRLQAAALSRDAGWI